MDQHIVTAWAEEYARLEWRLADVISERDAYRDVARATLDQLHTTTKTLERTRVQLRRLTEQARAHQTSLSMTDSERTAA